MNREAEQADIPLIMQDERRMARNLRNPRPVKGWAAAILPDPFENKCLVSENTPSPF